MGSIETQQLRMSLAEGSSSQQPSSVATGPALHEEQPSSALPRQFLADPCRSRTARTRNTAMTRCGNGLSRILWVFKNIKNNIPRHRDCQRGLSPCRRSEAQPSLTMLLTSGRFFVRLTYVVGKMADLLDGVVRSEEATWGRTGWVNSNIACCWRSFG